MKNISKGLVFALAMTMSLATIPSYAKKDDKDDKKDDKKAAVVTAASSHGSGSVSAASSNSSSHSNNSSASNNNSHSNNSSASNHATNNSGSNNNAARSTSRTSSSVSTAVSTNRNNGGGSNSAASHSNNSNNNSQNHANKNNGGANKNNNDNKKDEKVASKNGGNKSVSVSPVMSNRDHGMAVLTSTNSNNGNGGKKDKDVKNKDLKDKKDKTVAGNPKEGSVRNKDKSKTDVAIDPAPTHQASSEDLKAQLLALGMVVDYQGNISCNSKENRDMCYKIASSKAVVDQYNLALKREENQRQMDKAKEAADALEKQGIKASDAEYGAKVVFENGRIHIADSVGNNLTGFAWGSVDEMQMQMRAWDVDPATFKQALEADLARRSDLPASDIAIYQSRIDQAVSSYVRNPLVAYGNQYVLPTTTFKNQDGSYQVPGTQKWFDNWGVYWNAESVSKNPAVSQTGAHILTSYISRELPFDYEKILSSPDPLGAFLAAYSAYNADPEWRKIDTAWKNHMALVAGNKYVKPNHDVDTSGIVFDYAGNASGGVNTGSGFAGTGYEAGYLPGESTDNETYPGVQGDEPLVYENANQNAAKTTTSTVSGNVEKSSRSPASVEVNQNNQLDNVVDLTGAKK